MGRTVLGLEAFLNDPPGWAKTARVGLLTHAPAVDAAYRASAERLADFFGTRLKTLFGPQHGFFGDKQDNMIASDHGRHPGLGRRVFSLYGEKLKPDQEMLAGLEVLLVDLQDVGTRVYTYVQTLFLVMEACAEQGLKVVVLDRPNPLGRAVEGNLMEESCRSFVGLMALPMRHGLTVAELARLIRDRHHDLDLEVAAMKNYDPRAYFEATGLGWVMPSPNMPAVETAVVYPGQVIFEGTLLSEGRGTTRPFEILGAPYIEPYRLAERLAAYDLAGVVFRPVFFEPTFNKHAGSLCGGLFLHVIDRESFRPYRTSLAILQAVAELWPADFAYKPPPYEYEHRRRPIDLILGRPDLADMVVGGLDLEALEGEWAPALSEFRESCQDYYLY